MQCIHEEDIGKTLIRERKIMGVTDDIDAGQIFIIRCNQTLDQLGKKTRAASNFQSRARKQMLFQESSKDLPIIKAQRFFPGKNGPVLLDPIGHWDNDTHIQYPEQSSGFCSSRDMTE